MFQRTFTMLKDWHDNTVENPNKKYQNFGSASPDVIRVLLTGPKDSGKTSFLSYITSVLKSNSSTFIDENHVNVVNVNYREKSIIFCDNDQPYLWQPQLYGERVDVVVYVIDGSIDYTNDRIDQLYYQLHTLMGEAFQKKVSLILLFNKFDLKSGNYDVDSMAKALRIDAMRTCSWYQ